MDNAFFTMARTAVATAMIGASVAAYAANPIADEKIAVAKASLQRAEQSGAPQSAPVELATARDKLARAEQANLHHDVKPATMWAEQADVDAQVAEAASQLDHSKKAAAEFDASMQALRQASSQTAQ